MNRYILPPELRSLPSVTAKRWLQLDTEYTTPNLEGTEFDRDGNLLLCRRLKPGSEVLKVDSDRNVKVIYHEDQSNLIGLAVHRDGRLFLCDIKGRLPVITPDGEFLFDLMESPGLERFTPNDLSFDKEGNLYVTDFHENPVPIVPEGGVYRFEHDDYSKWSKLVGGMVTPNGVGLAPDEKSLWVCESMTNDLIQVLLGPDNRPIPRFRAVKHVLHTNGNDMMDSLKVDDEGNVYIAMMGSGRVLVTNSDGIAIQNILLEDRDEGCCLMSPNLAIHPTKPEGYIVTSGVGGSRVYRFETLAPAGHMFAFT